MLFRSNQLPIDGVVIRNFEAFFFLKERGFDKKIILDHNLYIFNQYGKEFWKQQKVEDFTAPLELNSRELRELDIRDGELLVYGRIPVMVSAQCIERTTSGCSKTVSYTHLDVYKRQSYTCGYNICNQRCWYGTFYNSCIDHV